MNREKLFKLLRYLTVMEKFDKSDSMLTVMDLLFLTVEMEGWRVLDGHRCYHVDTEEEGTVYNIAGDILGIHPKDNWFNVYTEDLCLDFYDAKSMVETAGESNILLYHRRPTVLNRPVEYKVYPHNGEEIRVVTDLISISENGIRFHGKNGYECVAKFELADLHSFYLMDLRLPVPSTPEDEEKLENGPSVWHEGA